MPVLQIPRYQEPHGKNVLKVRAILVRCAPIRWLAHRLFQFVPQICTVTVSHSPNCNFEDLPLCHILQIVCHILRIANLRTSHYVTFSRLQFGGLVFFLRQLLTLDSFGDGHGRCCSRRTEKWWIALSSISSLNCRHIFFTAQCAPPTSLLCTEKIQTTRLYQLLHPLHTWSFLSKLKMLQ
jgi:hypothetical protein